MVSLPGCATPGEPSDLEVDGGHRRELTALEERAADPGEALGRVAEHGVELIELLVGFLLLPTFNAPVTSPS